jgi:hypothetical protein
MQIPPGPAFTPSTVAEILDGRVTARTVTRWCRAGRITTIGKLAGTRGAWLIGPEGVDQARELVGQDTAA